MSRWLLIVAAAPLLAVAPARAETGQGPRDRAPKARTLNLRLVPMPEPSQQPLFDGGMVLRRDLGPNAGLGIGLLSMSAGRKGANLRSDGARRSRKPAISFSFKF